MTPEHAAEIIDKIIEEDDFMGDVYLTAEMYEALEFAKRNLKKERLQGKWIDRMADKGYVECPFCHKQITGGDLNFCVKCGADMRVMPEDDE